MLNLIGYVNAGYTIFCVFAPRHDRGLVIAKRENEYVVWYFNMSEDKPDFYWGHYSPSYKLTMEVFNSKTKTWIEED